MIDPTFWKNKVFLTGHTGFKGSWFSFGLHLLGAHVRGYSLNPTHQYHFNEVKLTLFDCIGDIEIKKTY